MPVDLLLDLALIYAAGHGEDAALRICDAVLDLRASDRAVVLRAWCTLWHTPGAAYLDPQVGPLEAVAWDDQSAECGAAAMVLAWLHRECGRTDPQLLIGLLERSVAKNPDWVRNRTALASERLRAGDLEEGMAEFERAVRNLRPSEEPADPVAAAYHDCFSGRFSDTERNLRGTYSEWAAHLGLPVRFDGRN
jgi:hypothetical protein